MYSAAISIHSHRTCQPDGGMLELAPMEKGFSLLGRFILCFLIVEIVLTLSLAISPLLESAARTSPFVLAYWAAYAIESFPLSIATAVLYTGFAMTRTLHRRLGGYIILFAASCSILIGGVVLSRKLPHPPESFPTRLSEPISETSRLPYFVRESSGTEAMGIVTVREAGTEPRLVWTASGKYLSDKGALLTGRVSLPAKTVRSGQTVFAVLGFRELRAWYLDLGKEPLHLTLIAVAGTALLLCGLWPLSRLFRWPLIGVFLSGAAWVSLGSLHAVFRSPAVRDLAVLVGLRLPASMLIGILSGACGLALFALDFAICPPLNDASAGRNRGWA